MVAEVEFFQSLLLNSLSVLFLFVKSVILLVVTEEFGEDSDAANAELNRFLDINVNTFIDAQIINGLGTGETLTGLLASAPDYVPAASGCCCKH
jgi:hypothetical protein